METIQEFQSHPYDFEVSRAAVHFLNNLRTIEDSELLYQLSLKCEPSMWANALEATVEVLLRRQSDADDDKTDSGSASPTDTGSNSPYDSDHDDNNTDSEASTYFHSDFSENFLIVVLRVVNHITWSLL
jgi:hypothetical protein